jgi:carotenoid cleavage dioxygenase-like enzyme
MQFDPIPGTEQVTVVTRIGLRNEHRIDAIDSAMKRRRIGGAPAGRPPEYMHSFAMTEHFVVLPLQPLRYSLPGILRSGKFTECLSWRPQDGTTFVVIDRKTGKVTSKHKTEAFFFWHTINAYEDGNEIVVDIVCADSPQSLYDVDMDQLRDPGFKPRFYGNVRRYRLPIAGGETKGSRISDLRTEFPRINDAYNTLRYQYVYTISYRSENSDWFDSINKLDVDSGQIREWHEAGCYPSEPIFVVEPGAAAEDQGVILSAVLDSNAGCSFMLVLDAGTLSEIARAELPHHLPFNFHGQYYTDA